jgi:hypothetical protein
LGPRNSRQHDADQEGNPKSWHGTVPFDERCLRRAAHAQPGRINAEKPRSTIIIGLTVMPSLRFLQITRPPVIIDRRSPVYLFCESFVRVGQPPRFFLAFGATAVDNCNQRKNV